MKQTLAFAMLLASGFVFARSTSTRWTWSRVVSGGILAGLLFALARMLSGCGGEAFTVGDALARLDAGDVDAQAPIMSSPNEDDAGDAGIEASRDHVSEASVPADRDVETTPPAVDAGSDTGQGLAPAVDAGPPPPPPALCCMTPCQGAAVAPITCDNGPPWICSAGTCTDRACAVGATCTWMGSCVGRVAVCP